MKPRRFTRWQNTEKRRWLRSHSPLEKRALGHTRVSLSSLANFSIIIVWMQIYVSDSEGVWLHVEGFLCAIFSSQFHTVVRGIGFRTEAQRKGRLLQAAHVPFACLI
ncbi:MAG: hypothetical protein ABW019_07725 [Chitinophagaceae bacterium]